MHPPKHFRQQIEEDGEEAAGQGPSQGPLFLGVWEGESEPLSRGRARGIEMGPEARAQEMGTWEWPLPRAGDRVQAHGLKTAPHLNGASGRVVRIDHSAERYSRPPQPTLFFDRIEGGRTIAMQSPSTSTRQFRRQSSAYGSFGIQILATIIYSVLLVRTIVGTNYTLCFAFLDLACNARNGFRD